jgi:FkbM family methyltransferase
MSYLFKKIWQKVINLNIIDRRHLYKYYEQEHLKRLLFKYDVDCVFDIGANNGQYARMLRREVGYRGLIVSFEPNPQAAAEARKLAEGDSLWIVEEMAISSTDGHQIFHLMADSQFSSLSQPRHDESDLFKSGNAVENSIQVRTETLSTAYARIRQKIKFERPFLKMDTQGYDVEIVSNAGPSLSNFVGLQSELAVKKIYNHSVGYNEAISLYEKCGFELSAFVPNNGGHFPYLIETDCIMIRKVHKMDL